MEQSKIILHRLQATKFIKNQLVQKLAQLQEYTIERAELQRTLVDCNTRRKMLQNQQRQHLKVKQQLEQQNEEIQREEKGLISSIDEAQSLKSQLQDYLQDYEHQKDEICYRIKELSLERDRIEGNIEKLNRQSMQVRCGEKRTEDEWEDKKGIEECKGAMIVKMRQSYDYFASRLQEDKRSNELIMNRLSQARKQQNTLQQNIVKLSKKHDNLTKQIQNQSNQSAIHESNIKDQMLKGKVLKQKYQMLSSKLAQLKQQEASNRVILEEKRQMEKEMRRRQLLRWEKFNAVRQKIGIELQYGRHYCSRLKG